MMVGVYANTAFVNYASGTFTGCPSNSDSGNNINHAVLLYGWDSNGNWLIKNQWSTGWGVNGFMTLSSSVDCGMSSMLGSITFTSTNTNVQVVMNPNYTLTSTWEYSLGIGIALLLLSVLAVM
jgi:hypothetical protein